jgi:hypothetical protein
VFAFLVFRRRRYRAIDGHVSSAPAQIPREPNADLLERRPSAKRHGRHDHPRRADAALRPTVLDEGALQRMTSVQPFDRRHARPVNLRDRYET